MKYLEIVGCTTLLHKVCMRLIREANSGQLPLVAFASAVWTNYKSEIQIFQPFCISKFIHNF